MIGRSGDSDLQTSRPHRLNDLGQAFGIGNNSAEWHVGLHSPSECGLSVLAEVVDFMDNDHLKTFLLLAIKLLTSSDLLDELLHDDLVVVVRFAWGHLDVIITRKDDAFHGGGVVRSRLELFQLGFDLVHRIRLIKLLQDTLGERPLATSRGPVKQNVWEIITLRQLLQHRDLIRMHRLRLMKIDRPVFFDPKSVFR